MRRRISLFLLPCCLIALCSGCTTLQCGASKDHFLGQYSRFIEEVKAMDITTTDPKWNIYDESFEVYILECFSKFEEELSFSEKQDVMYQAVEYYYHRYKTDMFRELESSDNEVSLVVRRELHEIWGEPEKLFKEITGEDWEELLEEFNRDMEKWKQRLHEMMGGETGEE